MMVQVTQEDIDQGVPGDPQSCPVALALRREGFPTPTVSTMSWYEDYQSFTNRRRHSLSRFVQQRIKLYDAGKGMKPFRFRVLTP